MPIQFDYSLCAMAVEEAPEMVMDDRGDVREVPNSDFSDKTDEDLEESITRLKKLSGDVKMKDGNWKLVLHTEAMETELAARRRSKCGKQGCKQISEKRGVSSAFNSTDFVPRSLKERRIEPPSPAFQEDLRIQRFQRGIKSPSPCSNGNPNVVTKVHTVQEPVTTPSPKPVALSQSKPSSRKRPPKAGAFSDTVVLFSSDDESLDNGIHWKRDDSKRRTSQRLEQKRKVNLNQKIAYPSRDDPDAVEVYYRDLDHLRPMEFLNDTVIDFYIKYLQRPEVLDHNRKEKFHFFNSFFFKKLTEAFDTEADRQAEAFTKLRKWTKGIKIFDKSYLFLPINDRLHWSLAIVGFSKAEGSRELVPHVFHLDSLDGGHSSRELFKYLRRYLELEHGKMEFANKVSWTEMVTKRVEVPRQDNEYDCGLFLLYYIERFVETVPLPCKLTEDTNLFGRRWFRPSQASSLRSKIREILDQLFEEAPLD